MELKINLLKFTHIVYHLTLQKEIQTAETLTHVHGRNGFSFYKMAIKQEYAKIIDDFFSMYGYKVNEVKIPNVTGRQNWNYVKTIDCNLLGDIPQEDMQKLKDIFNTGVTFWHNPNTFLDYSQSNN